MAIINVDDAYILNETGAQVDKTTGIPFKNESLTDAEAAQARANIRAGGTNPNLLDNPWWGTGEAVNQRGVTSGTGGWFVDRWTFTFPGAANVNWTANENGITGTTTTNFIMYQVLENAAKLNGKTLTASVMLSDGTIHSGTIQRTNGTGQQFFSGSNPSWNVRMESDNSFRIRVYTGTLSIRAVKLELGSVSTLANDVPPELSIASIPCYESHLRLKGQYAPVGYAIALSSTLALLAIPTPVPMRIAPTPSLSGTLYFNAGTPFAITSVQNPTLGVNQVMIQVVGTFDTGKVYLAQFRDANSYLDLSANL